MKWSWYSFNSSMLRWNSPSQRHFVWLGVPETFSVLSKLHFNSFSSVFVADLCHGRCEVFWSEHPTMLSVSMVTRQRTAAPNLITFLPLVLCEGQTAHISLIVTHRDGLTIFFFPFFPPFSEQKAASNHTQCLFCCSHDWHPLTRPAVSLWTMLTWRQHTIIWSKITRVELLVCRPRQERLSWSDLVNHERQKKNKIKKQCSLYRPAAECVPCVWVSMTLLIHKKLKGNEKT